MYLKNRWSESLSSSLHSFKEITEQESSVTRSFQVYSVLVCMCTRGCLFSYVASFGHAQEDLVCVVFTALLEADTLLTPADLDGFPSLHAEPSPPAVAVH